MNAKVQVPAAVKASFPVRRMDFDFSNVARYWIDHDAGLTHFMTAMSALFPAGERFFVDSVRAVRNNPLLKDDLAMQKEISAFIGQEAMHSKEHEGFNQSARDFGYDVDKMEKWTRKVIDVKRFLPIAPTQKLDLAATCALEHFTATIAAQLLRRGDLQDLMKDPVMYKLWMWHAIEENEHKAVAYDVFERLYGKGIATYALRCFAMGVATVLLFVTQTYFMAHLMKQDKKLGWRNWTRAVRTMYGVRQGFFTQIAPELLDYFRPSFHPNDHDTVDLLAEWKQKLNFTAHH
ncbi:MAG: metal-dependent hydrolase [Pseudomonadota bacterium]|nr:metal-dependent hydrolase [Pseudomonadota bacterium]